MGNETVWPLLLVVFLVSVVMVFIYFIAAGAL